MKKTILITGSTDGIGKLAAIRLASEGHTIILHGRNSEKLAAVIEKVKSQTNNHNITGYTADFSDFSQVQDMAEGISNDITTLDILINNAGIFLTPTPLNKKGLDIRLAVNYLAPYLLTKAILPVIKNSPAPRIINLSSAAQETVSMPVLNGDSTISNQATYAQSKLAILMWSFHLAAQESRINTIALNPGSLLNTNMVREAYGKFWSPAEKGGDIIYDLAIKDDYRDASGKYYDNDAGRFNRAHDDAYDESLIHELITQTDNLLTAISSS